MCEFSNLPLGIEKFIELSSSFVPTPNRRAFEIRPQSQNVYNLATSHFSGMDPEGREVSEKKEMKHDDMNDSALVRSQLGFIFGGFVDVICSLENMHRLFKRFDLDSMKSFAYQSEQLLNKLIEQVKNEQDITWLNFKINLREWIGNLCYYPKHNTYLNTATITFPLVLISQYCGILILLHISNLTLCQLKAQVTFSAGFSLGSITSYIVSISSSEEQLVKNALNSIEAAFWLGFRLCIKFQQVQLKVLNQEATDIGNTFSTVNPVVRSGSVQISDVDHAQVASFLADFNAEFSITNLCPFEICVILQRNRVTISGSRSWMPKLISSLVEKFPNARLTEIPLDLPVHSCRHFEDVGTLVLDDLNRNQVFFDSNDHCQQYDCISSVDGQLIVLHTKTMDEIILGIAGKVCRWDLVSVALLERLKSTHELQKLLLIDIGPGVRSKDLLNNFKHIQPIAHEKSNYVNRVVLYPIAEALNTLTTVASIVQQNKFLMSNNNLGALENSIAIVGMACRFPHALSPEEYFYNLCNKKNCISVIPKERWEHHRFVTENDADSPYKMKARHLGLLEDIDMFDPKFFNLNNRDASHMDPQQRLTMECCFLALENGGYVINEGYRLGMSEFRIGIFVGTSASDHYRKNMQAHLDAYLPQCGSRSFQAGRVSYFFKFCGPSIQIDTACSASMTCLHLACQSIATKECDAAVVSGVLVNIDPVEYAGLAAGGFLSPSGQCKAFSADADGYVRSDGLAAIVIRPYKEAVKNYDFIHSIIRATNANQSGQAQNILLPSRSQISSLMLQCLEKASLRPSDIQYVEAHATGTQGGDPIEVNAIIDALGKETLRAPYKHNPLYLGSHKAFIGHTEAASGLAGIIKVSMMLQHKLITPHFELQPSTMNQEILINNINTDVVIPTTIVPWTTPTAEMPRRAMINSFGFSGANACCILQEVPTLALPVLNNDRKLPTEVIVTLSAKHPDSLRALIMRMVQYLISIIKNLKANENPKAEMNFLRSLSYTTTARRTHFAHRIAVVANDVTSLVKRLFSVIQHEPLIIKALKYSFFPDDLPDFILKSDEKYIYSSAAMTQLAADAKPDEMNISKKIVFIFGGQGSQYYKMCQELIQFQPSFDMTLRLCSKLFDEIHPGYFPNQITIYSFLTHSNPACLLDTQQFRSTLFIQPLLFSIQYSLGSLLFEWAIKPDFMIGHSFGEIVAACLGNAITLFDALFLIGHRAKLMHSCPGGAMLACNVSISKFESIRSSLNFNAEDISVASHNTQNSIVVAGSDINIQIMEDFLEKNKVCRKYRLSVGHAFHSHLMQSIRNKFQSIAECIVYQPSSIPIICNFDGVTRTEFNGEYWAKQIISTVKFHQSIEFLKQLSEENKFQPIFVELSPKPVLAPYLLENDLKTIITLNTSSSDIKTIYSAIAQLYCCINDSGVSSHGFHFSWDNFHRFQLESKMCRVLSLPSYVFNSKSFWLKLPWACNDTMITQNPDEIASIVPSSRCINLPQLGLCEYTENRSTHYFRVKFPIFDRPWKLDIQNHVVNQNRLFSIPLYISAITQIYTYAYRIDGLESMNIVLENVLFSEGFIWEETDDDPEKTRILSFELFPPIDTNISIQNNAKFVASFKVSSTRADNVNRTVSHATGYIYSRKIDNSSNLIDMQSSFSRAKSKLNGTTEYQGNISYDTEEFYHISSEVNTYYGPHFRSIQLFVCDENRLTSWTKQIINTEQPYPCDYDCNVYPPYLDSFLQSYGVQAHLIKGLQTPFVAVFVEKCIIQLNQFNQNSLQNRPLFFAETTIKINDPRRITCSTVGFDQEGKCLMLLNGLRMVSTQTKPSIQKKNSSTTNHPINKSINSQNASVSIKNLILSILCDTLECEAKDIDEDEDFSTLGVDSLLSIEIRQKVQKATRTTLSYSVLFDYPSVNSLNDHLLSMETISNRLLSNNLPPFHVNGNRSDERDENMNLRKNSYPNMQENLASHERISHTHDRSIENKGHVWDGYDAVSIEKKEASANGGIYSKKHNYHTMQATNDNCRRPYERSAHLIHISNESAAELASNEAIIFMHTSHGRIGAYKELTKIFGKLKRRMYGIEAFGLEDGELSEHSMSVILKSYADAIKQIYPHGGTFTIVGYSSAGILAYLFAIKLLKFRRPEFLIKSIILIDSGAPTDKRLRSLKFDFIDYVVEQVVISSSMKASKSEHKKVLSDRLITCLRRVITAHLLSIRDYFYSDIPPVYAINSFPSDKNLDDGDPETYFVAHGAELGCDKLISSIINRITLIRAHDAQFFTQNFETYEPSLDWNPFLLSVVQSCNTDTTTCISIRMHTIDADHFNILDSPQVQNVASFLIENQLI